MWLFKNTESKGEETVTEDICDDDANENTNNRLTVVDDEKTCIDKFEVLEEKVDDIHTNCGEEENFKKEEIVCGSNDKHVQINEDEKKLEIDNSKLEEILRLIPILENNILSLNNKVSSLTEKIDAYKCNKKFEVLEEKVDDIHKNCGGEKNFKKEDILCGCNDKHVKINEDEKKLEIDNSKLEEILRLLPILENNILSLNNKVSSLTEKIDAYKCNKKTEPIATNSNADSNENPVKKPNTSSLNVRKTDKSNKTKPSSAQSRSPVNSKNIVNTSSIKGSKNVTIKKTPKKKKGKVSKGSKKISKNKKPTSKLENESLERFKLEKDSSINKSCDCYTPMNEEILDEDCVLSIDEIEKVNADELIESVIAKIECVLSNFKITENNDKSEILCNLSKLEKKMNIYENNMDSLMCKLENIFSHNHLNMRKQSSNKTQNNNCYQNQQTKSENIGCMNDEYQEECFRKLLSRKSCTNTSIKNNNNIDICDLNKCVCALIGRPTKNQDMILCEFLKSNAEKEQTTKFDCPNKIERGTQVSIINDKRNDCSLSICSKKLSFFLNDSDENNVELMERIPKLNCEKNNICDFLRAYPTPEWVKSKLKKDEQINTSKNHCGQVSNSHIEDSNATCKGVNTQTDATTQVNDKTNKCDNFYQMKPNYNIQGAGTINTLKQYPCPSQNLKSCNFESENQCEQKAKPPKDESSVSCNSVELKTYTAGKVINSVNECDKFHKIESDDDVQEMCNKSNAPKQQRLCPSQNPNPCNFDTENQSEQKAKTPKDDSSLSCNSDELNIYPATKVNNSINECDKFHKIESDYDILGTHNRISALKHRSCPRQNSNSCDFNTKCQYELMTRSFKGDSSIPSKNAKLTTSSAKVNDNHNTCDNIHPTAIGRAIQELVNNSNTFIKLPCSSQNQYPCNFSTEKKCQKTTKLTEDSSNSKLKKDNFYTIERLTTEKTSKNKIVYQVIPETNKAVQRYF